MKENTIIEWHKEQADIIKNVDEPFFKLMAFAKVSASFWLLGSIFKCIMLLIYFCMWHIINN